MQPVVGERIRQVRELRRLTQTNLAGRIGVKQSTISQIESGRTHASSTLLKAVADATGFPTEFFYRPPPREFPMGSLLFRARSSASVRDLAEAHRWAELVYECASELERRFERPLNSLPRLKAVTPSQGAELTRSALKLAPDRPMLNVTHALEQCGVMILAIPMKLEKRDAFSTWLDSNTAVVIVTTGIPGDRLRFSLAHEVGHLVLHHSQHGLLRELEREADRFASEFLLPEAGIEHELVPPITIGGLGHLKGRWGVSIQALIMRARELEVISTRRTQYLFKSLSTSGTRVFEPEAYDIPLEKPRALRRMMEETYGEPLDPRQVASDFDLPKEIAAAMVAAHATRQEVTAIVAEPGPTNVVNIRSRLARKQPPMIS